MAAAAGVFVVFALVLLLEAASWGVWLAFIGGQDYWAGFLIVGVVLIVLAAIAGFIASRAFKKGSPPTPQMAIDEARLIQETVKAPLEGGSAVAVDAAGTGAPGVATPAGTAAPSPAATATPGPVGPPANGRTTTTEAP